jgi:hypothetical protein
MTINSATRPCSASIIMRDGENPAGHRLVTDDAATLCVRAFPFAEIAKVAAAGALSVPGAYVLADVGQRQVYVGETGNLGRRLQEHALDASKNWVAEVFLLNGLDRRLDKLAVIHLQRRLSVSIEQAAMARLIAGVGACNVDLQNWRRASLDRMYESALPLLYDAGCRCVVPAPMMSSTEATVEGRGLSTMGSPPSPDEAVAADEEAEDGPMEVGVTTTPIGVEEQTLAFFDLWARGYEHQGRFVVAAGSEMRRVATASANAHTISRRQRLIEIGTATEIEGMDDRLRLQVAVAFPSKAIAAKVLCGAHVASDKWRPLGAERACVFAT